MANEKPSASAATAPNGHTQNSNFIRKYIPTAAMPFVIGGSSGIVATMCIQPIDMVKVRIQLAASEKGVARPSPFTVARDIVARNGVLGLYDGLSAGLLRQVVYGTTRLGLFFTFEKQLQTRAEKLGRNMTFVERAGAGLAAGGLGAIVGNPAEVALIRLQSDGMKPKELRANYRSVFDVLARTTSTEGISALWNGAYPTVIRAMAVNFGQLAFFSESKHQLSKIESMSEQMRTMSAASIAGFFAAFFSLPFDFTKTRLQNQTKGKDGSSKYKGMFDCFVKVAKDEGPGTFYRGFWTYFMRLAPHTIISLIVADNLKRVLE